MNSTPQQADQTPEGMPEAIVIERETLGHILVTGQIHESLTADCFHLEDHRRIWYAVVALRDRGEPIDRLSVYEELRTRKAGLELSFVADLESGLFPKLNIDNHVQILLTKSLARRIICFSQIQMKTRY